MCTNEPKYFTPDVAPRLRTTVPNQCRALESDVCACVCTIYCFVTVDSYEWFITGLCPTGAPAASSSQKLAVDRGYLSTVELLKSEGGAADGYSV